MRFRENLKIATKAIKSYKLRSLLTMLGLIIGMSSVITVFTLGYAAEKSLIEIFVDEENANLELMYQPSDEENQEARNNVVNQPAANFDTSDITQLGDLEGVKNVIAVNQDYADYSIEKNKLNALTLGITEQYLDSVNIKLEYGRNLHYTDFKDLVENRVIIVHQSLVNELNFNSEDLIGNTMNINGVLFEIIGVFSTNNDETPYAITPIINWKSLFKTEGIQSLQLEVNSNEVMDDVGNSAVSLLNSTKNVDGKFEIVNLEVLTNAFSIVSKVMTSLIASITAISLLVGGIGVMNMMLMSVTERTREIGIRKSLGAERKVILNQFLIESIIITTLGGGLGISLGLIIANIVTLILGLGLFFPLSIIIISFVFSSLIGAIFGVMPANKAANLKPIDALNHE